MLNQQQQHYNTTDTDRLIQFTDSSLYTCSYVPGNYNANVFVQQRVFDKLFSYPLNCNEMIHNITVEIDVLLNSFLPWDEVFLWESHQMLEAVQLQGHEQDTEVHYHNWEDSYYQMVAANLLLSGERTADHQAHCVTQNHQLHMHLIQISYQ